jgi:tRNA/tmRNA/rRNA uracil-C5-methylase (TrmA/RlmC/RlmD family)
VSDQADQADLSVGAERIVDIGTVAHGGHFIAHADGRTLFVRHALPGERARVRVTSVNRKIVRADAVEILVASPDRVAPPCPWAHADGCGGCDFQHVSLPAQRALKRQVLVESLQRIGGVTDDALLAGVQVAELPGFADGLHWRTRMRWAAAPDGAVGLLKHRSHELVRVDECLIAAPEVARPSTRPPGRVVREVRGRTWRLGSDDFWQVHPGLPDALVDAVLAACGPRRGETWWDLFSGAGLFSAFLGEAVWLDGRVDAVEGSEEGVRAARRALHDLPQVRLHRADVDAWIESEDHEAPDGVVLDPPRAGAGEHLVTALATAEVPVIVYVACDPASLARDASRLARLGYRIDALVAFDAFPMTHHFETVAAFRAS